MPQSNIVSEIWNIVNITQTLAFSMEKRSEEVCVAK